MHGWLIIDKPVGPGSTQVVGAVKRALREGGYAKVKVGHGGTLDPLASGVLPVALGEATKLSGRMLDADKAYDFTISFGEETDTLDAEGKVVATSERRPTLADVEAMLPRFTGAIDQLPPIYSALKVDGKRAYDLARAGEEVKLATRSVTIRELTIRHPSESWDLTSSAGAERQGDSSFRGNDGTGLSEITLSARVSKGTYIRSLARDIAHALNSVGHVTMLRRTRAGPFTLAKSISLDNLADLAKARRLEEALLPLAAGLDDIPALTVTPREADLLRVGQQPTGSAARPGLHLALLDDVPVALVECSGGVLRVVRGFNL
ncbi:MAG: tRNA pseudouridine(55) synthase TruB [Allosphingosinicella sp.]|uniref:tRNA pseudouridine(55) synthase TruB n=1 Tax=Allosphingosinicella sp. TaxID=2823234 RepID=UPI0039365B16